MTLSATARALKMILFALVFIIVMCLLSIVVIKYEPYENTGVNGSRITEDLQFVVVVSRHGNQGGTEDYFKDNYPISSTQYWPYGSMELTARGRLQMYKLGSKIRSLYNGLVSSTFYPKDLRAASTAADKAVISGQMFLAGLYPPSGQQPWYDEVLWQPVSIYSDSSDNTEAVGDCPVYLAASAAGKGQFSERYAENITSINQQIKYLTGVNQTGIDPINALWEKLLSEEDENYTDVPSWTDKFYPRLIQPLIGEFLTAKFVNTDEMVRLLTGDFFNTILGLMENKMNGSLSQSMYYFSGHETTLLGLQIILGMNRSSIVKVIKPASAMVFELHKNSTTGLYSLQVLYIDGSSHDNEPLTMNIPNCPAPCDFNTVVTKSMNFTSVNFTQECQLREVVTATSPA